MQENGQKNFCDYTKFGNYLYDNKIVRLILFIFDLSTSFLILFRKKKLPNKIEKILILKVDHIGDLLIATPAIKRLKEENPSSQIDIVVSPWAKQIVIDNPFIDNIYTLRHFIHNRHEKSFIKKIYYFIYDYLRLVFKLRKNKYDLVLVFKEYLGSIITIGRFINAGYVIGHSTSGGRFFLDKIVQWDPLKHEAEHQFEILEPLGIRYEKEKLGYYLNFKEDDYKKVENELIKYNLKENEFIIIHPGSGDKRRVVNRSVWLKVIEENQLPIVITGIRREEYLINEIINNTPYKDRIIKLVDVFTIKQMAIFISKAKHLYTVESLIMHLSSFSNTPTTIFWKLKKTINATHQWGPLNKKELEIIRLED